MIKLQIYTGARFQCIAQKMSRQGKDIEVRKGVNRKKTFQGEKGSEKRYQGENKCQGEKKM